MTDSKLELTVLFLGLPWSRFKSTCPRVGCWGVCVEVLYKESVWLLCSFCLVLITGILTGAYYIALQHLQMLSSEERSRSIFIYLVTTFWRNHLTVSHAPCQDRHSLILLLVLHPPCFLSDSTFLHLKCCISPFLEASIAIVCHAMGAAC